MKQSRQVGRGFVGFCRRLLLVALLVVPLTSVGCESFRECYESYRECRESRGEWSGQIRWVGGHSGDEERAGGTPAEWACLLSFWALRCAASNSH